MRIAYAVNPDARLSWGGLPPPGRDLSSVRADACHLMDMVGNLVVEATARCSAEPGDLEAIHMAND